MIHEYEKNYERDKVVLPIPCVRDNGFYPETFLEASGTQQDGFLVLKSLGITFSVLEFLTKTQTLFLFSGAALRFFPLGFASGLCME